MDLKLKDRTCVVTGASRGIATVLAAEGCRVAVVARSANLLAELVEALTCAALVGVARGR